MAILKTANGKIVKFGNKIVVASSAPTVTGYALTYSTSNAGCSVEYANGTTADVSGEGTIYDVTKILSVWKDQDNWFNAPSINGASISSYPVILTTDSAIILESQCLAGATLITLADYTQKRIDQLTLADQVLSVNQITNELIADEIVYCDADQSKTHNEYDIWTFEDNYIITTVHRPRLYNCESEAFVNLDE